MTGERLAFTCNVCGRPAEARRSELGRETASCAACGSTVRYRAVVHLLSTELFGESLPLVEFPARPDIAGAGLSDWEGYSGLLAEPRLDVADPPAGLAGTLDFLIASDVFEHVAPPVERAFRGAHGLLAPGGALVLTVPYGSEGETVEHFPELCDYEVVEVGGLAVVLNRTADGRWQVFDEPIFHGGAGETLEMRVFSRSGLLRCLEQEGFVEIAERGEDVERYGIVWQHPWSLPVLARRARR